MSIYCLLSLAKRVVKIEVPLVWKDQMITNETHINGR